MPVMSAKAPARSLTGAFAPKCKGSGKAAERQRKGHIKATLNFTYLIEPLSLVAFHKLAGLLVCPTALIYNLTTPRSADIPLFLRLVGPGQ